MQPQQTPGQYQPNNNNYPSYQPNPFPGQQPQGYNGMPGQYPPIMQGPPKKSRKKLFLILGAILFLLILMIVLIIISPKEKSSNNLPTGNAVLRAYDSPIGLLPQFQAQDIKNGRFKLTASYVTNGDFSREGTFYVEDGRVYFDMLPDAGPTNTLLNSLSQKQGLTFDEGKQGATRNFTFDFSSMLGYQKLFDANASNFGGFVPAVEKARNSTQTPAKSLITTSAECNTALDALKAKANEINTKTLQFEKSSAGVNKEQATIGFASRQEIDKTVITFFEKCYDLTNAEATNLKKYTDDLRDKSTSSPTFTYWQENGRLHLTVGGQGKDVAFGGELRFELYDLNEAKSTKTGSSGSYREHSNMFGLAYSVCRVPPVIGRDLGTPLYYFAPEDANYTMPSDRDSGYFCTTLNTPNQFKSPTLMNMATGRASKSIEIKGEDVAGFRAYHDVAYLIEKYNIDNKRYPSPTEFADLANNNMGSLTSVTQGKLGGGGLTYKPAPASCIGNCTSYSLTYLPSPNEPFVTTTYKP